MVLDVWLHHLQNQVCFRVQLALKAAGIGWLTLSYFRQSYQTVAGSSFLKVEVLSFLCYFVLNSFLEVLWRFWTAGWTKALLKGVASVSNGLKHVQTPIVASILSAVWYRVINWYKRSCYDRCAQTAFSNFVHVISTHSR